MNNSDEVTVPRLWVVDDNRNRMVDRLRLAVNNRIRPYCGSGMLESFIVDLEREAVFAGLTDYFVLDIFMPIPKRMRVTSYWGQATMEMNTCGFAVARWLVDQKQIPVARVRMASNDTDSLRERSKFGFGEDLVCVEGWSNASKLWAEEWFASVGAS